MRRAVAAVRRRAGGGDAGLTMVEVVVTTVVMSFVLAIFTTAMLQLTRSGSRTQTVAQAQSQLNNAFLRLDTQIRYASAISQQGTVGGDPYVEYLTTNSGSRVCAELRLHGGALQSRTWIQPAAPAVPGPGNVTPTPWVALATNVSAATPFRFYDADPTLNFQRLELILTAGGPPVARQTDVTFTALNTSLDSTGDTSECAEGRLIP